MVYQDGPRLSPANEKYLEAIFRLETEKTVVRVTDLAIALGLKKGTVSGAVKTLKMKRVIDAAPYQSIRLTSGGRRIAEKITRRNLILAQFLCQVPEMDAKTSESAARRKGAAVDEGVNDRMSRMLDREDGGPCLDEPGWRTDDAVERDPGRQWRRSINKRKLNDAGVPAENIVE